MLFSTTLVVAATSVSALPKSSRSRPPLPGFYIFANGTRVEEHHPLAPRPLYEGPLYEGPIHLPALKRQEGRCDIEVGGREVVAQDLDAGPDEFPQAFSQLFDHVASTLCSNSGCDTLAEYCVTASTGANVCVSADGNYIRKAREAFIRSTRGSFDRAVRRQRPGQGVIETGPNFVHFQSRGGPFDVGDLRVTLRNEEADGGDDTASCGPIISTVAAGGALFPQVAAPFGALSFFCGTADTFAGIASG